MNRKARRANKIPPADPERKVPAPKYEVTFAGANPDSLSRKERAIILAMITQVPFLVHQIEQTPVPEDVTDPPFSFPHVHVVFDQARKVCLRWTESAVARVVERRCSTL